VAAQEATNVDGTARMLAAAAAAGVGAVVVASSVAAYSPGPKDRAVDESWPTEGIPSSAYSRQKERVERLLDAFEADQPDVRIVLIRPGLVLQGSAGSEIARYLEPPGRRILTAIRGLVVGPGRDG
jgi:UDP-glucose 4-epimerase